MTTNDQEILNALAATAKRRGSSAGNRVYIISRDGDKTQRLAPQAVVVLAVLFDMNKEQATEGEMIAACEASEKIVTRQKKSQIFNYYKKSLIKAGWLRQVDQAAPVAPTTPPSDEATTGRRRR